MSSTRIPPSGLAPPRKPTDQELQAQAEQQLNQLVGELRLLEGYYQEIVGRQQTASAALSDARSAIEALNALSKSSKNEVLLPLGAGVLVPASNIAITKLVVSLGAGVAIEKDVDSTRLFLQTRQKELESAIMSLEQQRREVGSRLEAGRATLQEITQQS